MVFANTVVSRDTIVSGYGYFGLQTESRRNICLEIPRKVRHLNEQFYTMRNKMIHKAIEYFFYVPNVLYFFYFIYVLYLIQCSIV